jgi:NAD(P)-dependent dehydrogenase (short-subunit alcohol dehydrogenase family)
MKLKGMNALVTGSGHRVGRDIALGLAKQGCNMILHYHSSDEKAQETLREIEACGVGAISFKADLRDQFELKSLFSAADSSFDRLDILVNSAAIMEKIDFLDVDSDAWYRTMALNIRAPFFCIQEAARQMLPGKGVVINISDIAGMRPWASYPVHSISKAGIEMLTQVAAAALAPDIRVNAVAPGPVTAVPLQRPGKADDVSRAVIFLIENDYITGETLAVDGGNKLL